MITVSQFVGGVLRPILQDFGRTEWSMGGGRGLYTYASSFCLAEASHPGVDFDVAAGTPLYSPVNGRVRTAGGSGVFEDERFGTAPGRGELKIETSSGLELIFGHMEYIDVATGDQVVETQYIGRSGVAVLPHVHLECRMPNPLCYSGYECVYPMPIFIGESRTRRFFRVSRSLVVAYEQATVRARIAGRYQVGEIVPCNLVIQAEEVEPGEAAWGRIEAGRLADNWLFLGYTREVHPERGLVRVFSVESEFVNVYGTSGTVDPSVGSFERGAVLPISDVVLSEEVEPGEAAWGRIASGPFAGQWVYLGYTAEIRYRIIPLIP